MDAPRIYPRGIHLDDSQYDTQGKGIDHVRTRTQVGGVKYYFIDFGESIKFGPTDNTRITVESKASIGAPETLELSFWPYDAFKPDIYTLGTAYKEELVEACPFNSFLSYHVRHAADHTIQAFTSFDMLNPLLDAMTQQNPDARPSAAEALQLFQTIKDSLSRTTLHGRLHSREDPPESSCKHAFLNCLHYTKQIAWAAQNWKW